MREKVRQVLLQGFKNVCVKNKQAAYDKIERIYEYLPINCQKCELNQDVVAFNDDPELSFQFVWNIQESGQFKCIDIK